MTAPPIADVTKLDLLGKRQDGGVDMGIIAQAPIDSSEETLTLVTQKIRNYLREAQDESFRTECGIQHIGQIRILFESDYDIDDTALRLLSVLSDEAAAAGVTFTLRRSDRRQTH